MTYPPRLVLKCQPAADSGIFMYFLLMLKLPWWLMDEWKLNLRFLVKHHEAQQVSEVWGPESFPLHHDFITHGSNLSELQDVILT